MTGDSLESCHAQLHRRPCPCASASHRHAAAPRLDLATTDVNPANPIANTSKPEGRPRTSQTTRTKDRDGQQAQDHREPKDAIMMSVTIATTNENTHVGVARPAVKRSYDDYFAAPASKRHELLDAKLTMVRAPDLSHTKRPIPPGRP